MAEDQVPEDGLVAQQIALWADKLRHISAGGLKFARTPYDHERYRALQDMAIEMLARASARPRDEIEALPAPLFTRPGPHVGGNGAVIDDTDRILLMRRADYGSWAMPGGALDVGETPAAGVVREVWEETGVRCTPVALVGIYDSRLWDVYPLNQGQHIYKFTFLCTPVGSPEAGAEPIHKHETLAVGWFPEHALPDGLYEGHRPRIADAFRVHRGEMLAHFDPA